MKIAYESHPVTAERKAELRAQGFKILDSRFRPVEVEQEEQPGRYRAARKTKTGEE